MTRTPSFPPQVPPHLEIFAYVHELGNSSREFDWQLLRFHAAARRYTPQDLADFLGISIEDFRNARERGVMPAEWLLHLLREKRINPDWVLAAALPVTLS